MTPSALSVRIDRGRPTDDEIAAAVLAVVSTLAARWPAGTARSAPPGR